MAFITADFVKETSTTTGLGAIFLAGARAPARTVGSVCANGDTFHCAVSNTSANEWEVFVGTYVSGTNSVTRGATLSSSNGGAPVNFGAGTKFVDLVLPTTRIASFKTTLPLVSHIGGNSASDLSTLAFSNASNVTWSLSTGANAATVIASVAVGGGGGAALSAGTQSANTGTILFADSNGIGFGMSGSSQVTASYARELSIVSVVGVAATSKGSVRLLAFEDSNGVSWRFVGAGSSMTVRGSIASELGLVSHVGGNTVGGVTRLAFSNASNVTWSLSTAASAATVLASVPAETPFGLSAGTQSVSTGTLVFSDSNGVSFGMSGSSRVTASFSPIIGLVSHVGGNSQSNVTRIAFSDASNVTWSLSTAANAITVLASVAAGGGGGGGIGLSAGTQSVATGTVVFSDSNGVAFGMSGSSLVTASVSALKSISLANLDQSLTNYSGTLLSAAGFRLHNGTAVTAIYSQANVSFLISGGSDMVAVAGINFLGHNSTGGAVNFRVQHLSFASNSNMGITLTTNNFANFGSILQMSLSAPPRLGVVSHIGGNVVSNLTQLAFSNASNVTWSLSTAASAATVIASVAAGGGITAINLSAGTTNADLTNFVLSNSNNVSFGLNGSTVTATATVAATRELGIVSHIGGNVVSSVSQLAFSNASNVTFSLSTAANAATVIASVAAAGGGGITYSGFQPFRGEETVLTSLANGSLVVTPLRNAPAFQFDRLVMLGSFSNASNSTNSNTLRLIAGLYTRNGSTLSLLQSTTATYAFTGSGTVGNYSLFSSLRLLTVGWTTTLSASDYWIAIGSSLSTAGNAGVSGAFGLVSQNFSVAIGQFNAATNSTVQRALGQGMFSATSSVAPASIAFSQIVGSGLVGWRCPSLYFESASA